MFDDFVMGFQISAVEAWYLHQRGTSVSTAALRVSQPYEERCLVHASELTAQELESRIWPAETIETMMQWAREGRIDSLASYGGYGGVAVTQLIEGIAQLRVAGGTVLVIGSESPWVEACLLTAGAARTITVDYRAIRFEHPLRVTLVGVVRAPHLTALMLAQALREQYLSGHLEPFDAVVSYSSVEHSGLGRYGDPLNPWGDLVAMGQAWCLTKPGGRSLLAVPFDDAEDVLVFNAHRIYGPVRWPHLTANWQVGSRRQPNQPTL